MSATEIRAGRAVVELGVDQSELVRGLRDAERQIRHVDQNVGRSRDMTRSNRELVDTTYTQAELENALAKSEQAVRDIHQNTASIRAGMLANQFAVGLQDFAVVYEQSKDLGRALSAAANNAIQLATLINPWAGAITAAVIAGYQLYSVFAKTAEAAKKAREETEALQKSIQAQVDKDGSDATRRIGIKTVEEGRSQEGQLFDQRDVIDEQIQEIQRRRSDSMFWLGRPGNSPAGTDAIRQGIDELDKSMRALQEKRAEIDRQLAIVQGQITDLQPGEMEKERQDSAWADYDEQREYLIRQQQQRMDEARQANEDAARDSDRQDVADQDSEWDSYEQQRRDSIAVQEQRQADAEKARQEAEQAEQQAEREAESLRMQVESPAERKARLAARYEEMFEGGRLDQETFNRLNASLDQGRSSITGTFSGAALSGLGASSPLDKIQNATERSAKANEETAKNTRESSTFQ